MFDAAVYDDLLAVAVRVAASRTDLATSTQQAAALETIQAVQDILDGAKAATLQRFDAAEGYSDEGASSTKAWARQHLRLDPRQAGALVKAGATMTALPQVAESLSAGKIRLDHVHEFGLAVTKVGAELVEEAQRWLLDVAQTCEPAELKQVVNTLVDVVHPERLDAAWVAGMEKRDVQLSRVGDGYALDGFLDIVTGAKMSKWLDSAACPRSAEDQRTPAERRITALDDLITSVLDGGMPTDKGVRPHLMISVDAGRLGGDTTEAPATLAGFGPIGDQLLAQLTCVSDFTAFLVDGQSDGPTPQPRILNAGRSWRLATHKQRLAIALRQGGTCANPGCTNTHLELHHVAWWKRDSGTTDLDNLIGLCPRCHHLVHAYKLFIRPDTHAGWTFTRSGDRPLPDHRRANAHRIGQHLRNLRQLSTTTPAPDRREHPDLHEPLVRRPGRRVETHHRTVYTNRTTGSVCELHLAATINHTKQRPPQPPTPHRRT